MSEVVDVALFSVSRLQAIYPETPVNFVKLQKLLYFMQGCSYINYERPLFDEDIYAWPCGPTIREVQARLSIFAFGDIDLYLGEPNNTISDEDVITINHVLDELGSQEDKVLMSIISRHLIYKSTYAAWREDINNKEKAIINKEEIQSYFLKHKDTIFSR
jgi:uncharacterized phage-associated protein